MIASKLKIISLSNFFSRNLALGEIIFAICFILRFIGETLRASFFKFMQTPSSRTRFPGLFVIYVPTNNQICDNLLLTGKRGKAKFEDTGAKDRANRPTRDRG